MIHDSMSADLTVTIAQLRAWGACFIGARVAGRDAAPSTAADAYAAAIRAVVPVAPTLP